MEGIPNSVSAVLICWRFYDSDRVESVRKGSLIDILYNLYIFIITLCIACISVYIDRYEVLMLELIKYEKLYIR